MSWGNPETTKEKVLSTLLRPASAGFGLGLHARLMAYNFNVLKQQKFGVPVISVGNITVGGTGKTPVTIDVATRLAEVGHKVGVLSRGYKRQSKAEMVVVSDGKGTVKPCVEAGDEPFLIANAVPEAVVIVGAKRAKTAEVAVKEFGCTVLLLDDGFQHWPVARSNDIVLVDYNDDLTRDQLLPAGRLREPISALSRADWVVVTKIPDTPDLDKLLQIRSTIARIAPQAEITGCRMAPDTVQHIGNSSDELKPEELAGKRVVALSGIARPENLEAQLRELGAEVVESITFPDHHWYTQRDFDRAKTQLSAANAELIVTTEKDAVKMEEAQIRSLPIAVLQQRVVWLGPVPAQQKTVSARDEAEKLVTS